jgi:hypothetical protein
MTSFEEQLANRTGHADADIKQWLSVAASDFRVRVHTLINAQTHNASLRSICASRVDESLLQMCQMLCSELSNPR